MNGPTASFIEIKRWFSEKLDKYTKIHNKENDPWVNALKNSRVFAREDDPNDISKVTFYRIVGFEDHGDEVTLRIEKCKNV